MIFDYLYHNYFKYLHTGSETTWDGFNGETITLNQRAEVGLLSRNIKFLGSGELFIRKSIDENLETFR